MFKIMFVFLAIIIGLVVNYFTGGLPFSAILCIFAGIFLVMPSLLNFEFKDFKILKQEKKLTLINIVLNTTIIPIIFVGVAYILFPQNPEIWYSMAMVSILPGGGMLMSRIRQSKANTNFGFGLFVLNMTIFMVLFFGLNYLILNNFEKEIVSNISTQSCEISQSTGGKISCESESGMMKPVLAYFFLIILPFLISRVLKIYSKLKETIQKNIGKITKIGTFMIIFYIFSLQNIHGVFDKDVFSFIKTFFTVSIGYLILFGIVYMIAIYKKEKSDSIKSLFWNSTIRFLTLGVVFGFLYIPYLGEEYIIVFTSAYIVQTILATISLKFFNSKERQKII